MITKTYSETRRDLARAMDQVNADHVPILITRGSKPPAVLLSLEDFNGYAETAHLLASPANARRLDEAVAELRAGKGVEHVLDECD